MDKSATYSSVLKIGLPPEGAKAPPAKPRQPARGPWHPPAKVSLAAPGKAVRVERLPPGAEKPHDKRRDWDSRGRARAKDFVDAVLDGGAEKMKDAFYDAEFGRNPKLFELLIERGATGWKPSDEEGNLIKWFRGALKGLSIDQLHAVSENLYNDFGGHGRIFDATRKALAFSVGERIHADEMVRTALDDGDIGETAERFEGHYKTAGLDYRQRGTRMALLMQESLSTLDAGQMKTLEANLAWAPSSLAVTELRKLL